MGFVQKGEINNLGESDRPLDNGVEAFYLEKVAPLIAKANGNPEKAAMLIMDACKLPFHNAEHAEIAAEVAVKLGLKEYKVQKSQIESELAAYGIKFTQPVDINQPNTQTEVSAILSGKFSRLLNILGVSHDIGYIIGRDNHELNGADILIRILQENDTYKEYFGEDECDWKQFIIDVFSGTQLGENATQLANLEVDTSTEGRQLPHVIRQILALADLAHLSKGGNNKTWIQYHEAVFSECFDGADYYGHPKATDFDRFTLTLLLNNQYKKLKSLEAQKLRNGRANPTTALVSSVYPKKTMPSFAEA